MESNRSSQFEAVKHIHDYILGQVVFADAKIGVLVAANLAIFAILDQSIIMKPTCGYSGQVFLGF